MLRSFLNQMEDQGDYIAALALFRRDGALTDEEAGRPGHPDPHPEQPVVHPV